MPKSLSYLQIGALKTSATACSLLAFAALCLAGCVHYEPKPLALRDSAASFDQRSLTNKDLLAFVSAHVTNQPTPPESWTFDSLTLAAFYYHPSLQVARAQSETAAAGKITANTRPNPVIGLAPGYDFDAISPAKPWIPGMTIDVPIETAGKRGKRVLQAGYLGEAARLNIASTAWKVRGNLRSALIDAWAAHERERLIDQQSTNQSALYELLKQRLTAGAIATSELLPIQVGRVRLQADLAAARTAMVQARARVAEAVGIPLRGLTNAMIDEKIAVQIDTSYFTNTEALRGSALQHRADLLAALARYEAAQAALRLEIAKQYPDVRLGSGYQWDQGESKWTLSLNMEIPIFNRNRGPIAEAEARRSEMAAEVVSAQARVLSEIDSAIAALSSAQLETARAREAFAGLTQQSKLVRERLAVGGGDRVELHAALIEEDAASLLVLDADIRALMAAAQLEAALQVPVLSLNAASSPPP